MRMTTLIVEIAVSDEQTDEEAIAQSKTALSLCDFETIEVTVPTVMGA
jgi:hypothetical protein